MKNVILMVVISALLSACGGGLKGANDESAYYREDYQSNIASGTQMDLEINVGDRVFYGFDTAVLNEDAISTLSRQALWLKAHPELHVIVEGHCDARGPTEYNLALGERRANSVKNFLVSAGVNSDRVKTISYGKERLAVDGDTPYVHSQNRRGVIVIAN